MCCMYEQVCTRLYMHLREFFREIKVTWTVLTMSSTAMEDEPERERKRQSREAAARTHLGSVVLCIFFL
jgi:hypothetical protein